MPKTTRTRGGTVSGTATNQAPEPLLLGERLIIRDGRIEFLNASGVVDAVLSRDSAGVLRLTGAWVLEGAASGTDVLTSRVIGDANPQFVLNANGQLEWGPGSGAVDVNLSRDGSARLHTVNTFVTEGDLHCDVAGGGLNLKEGSNARSGVATLVAGGAVVATTEVSASSRIQLTVQSLGTVTAPKAIGVTARTAATSFTITSADATDTSVVAWMIVEPA
ncbi:hypothetical protein [Streptomyces sp. YIM S03343]